ncbi:glycine--tRNA ligase subunit beta [Sphingorhabdus sp. IMCC26285]|uniref:Glycine--tRNA ligase beta subunit n=1 Tax=Sphingorhabdus profundilacus TaxID=2509718 RepID=A0A6I4LTC0_9SPHN|nr:glycine--tRNA ligase subunit beta [Sphingorhabdus profundilacus]MVZ96301.1 glycine--tRNA ligase subunit beta [Sphingorhabdus profundilacus]
MADFLLELLSEEIPARMQVKAKEDLARLFNEALAKAGLAAQSVETFATPRRLALIAKGLPLATEAVSEETKGPKVGAPPQAMEGFLRKTGLTQDQLVERDGIYFAVVEKPGRNTADVLGDAIPAIIRAFPWPKSQRWGAASISTESLRWVRPLQGIIALLGNDIVPCAIDGIESGRHSMGHRFHSRGPIEIANADAYVEALRAAHVIVHFSERCTLIRDGAKAAAEAAGLVLVDDEGLVAENAGLTEWPVPMLGRFDPAFLEVPQEVIQLTARVNQKYFVCQTPHPLAGGAGDGSSSEAALPSPNPSRKREGDLANAFVCTANIVANDGGAAIVAGNEKVLAARLSDAKFFWEQDLKVPLDEQAKKLAQITFHEKLGTVADKVERVAKLARWLVEEGVVKGANADEAERAARLCKADLVTGMVGEFPELQGIMGGYYARAQGESNAVADAVRDHYKPVGQGDDVPTAPVTVAVSLADKLDTLLSFFDIKEFPTGSKDPFALRRASIAIIRLIINNNLKLHTDAPIEFWLGQSDPKAQLSDHDMERRGLLTIVQDFLADRLAVQQREAGIRHDFVSASSDWLGRGDGRLDRIVIRAEALRGFVTTDEGANLLAGYKRAANILKQSGDDKNNRHPELVSGSYSADGENTKMLKQVQHDGLSDVEIVLKSALDTAEPKAAAAVDTEDFEGAMAVLASLRAPIDAFFDAVMINDPDPSIRAFRLGLLARFRDAVHRVADFSKIEG